MLQPYFDLSYFRSYIPKARTSYDSADQAATWYKTTTDRLRELVSLLSDKLNLELVVNYTERPNGQGGRGKIIFKAYNLIGFIPSKFAGADEVFIKLFFEDLDSEDPSFGTEVDINAKLSGNRFAEDREQIRKDTYWSIPLAQMPQAWDGLLTTLEKPIRKNIDYISALLANADKRNSLATEFDNVELSESHGQERANINFQLNQILFGPPGTGKTNNTINKALQIARPSLDLRKLKRGEIKQAYDALVSAGRINFVTFHQSLSYEDFIEGIKPQAPEKEGDSVSYEVEDGIFKLFCNRARFTSGNFDEVIEKFKKDISAADGKSPLKIKSTGTTFDITYRGTNVFYVQPMNTTKDDPWYPVNIENIRKAFESESYDRIYNPTYVREVIVHLKRQYGLVKGSGKRPEAKENYVLIIDEINRGNVSQIFGELITLIETDKREGSGEALFIQLPYSKELFSVPDNLYIIGTMNTADRSVESLDSALRRRFAFEYMPPDSSRITIDGKATQVKGLSLSQLLDRLNERLAYLLDDDHQIGHAYFCGIKQDDEDALRQAMKNKIIPLLREYFYNDHGKIRLVLGERFVEQVKAKPVFAAKDDDDLVVEKQMYKVREITDDFDIVDALTETLHGKK